MASIQASVKSVHEGGEAEMEEKKRRRREMNREHARQSRMKKRKRAEDLTNEVSTLQSANKKLVESIKAKEEAYAEMEGANNILRAQSAELVDRLSFLDSLIEADFMNISGLCDSQIYS